MADSDITSGLISWWRFDENAGAVANDFMGNNQGTLISSPSWVTGAIGNALSFSGGSARVNTTINSNLSNSFTFACWINGSSYSGIQGIVVSEVASYTNYWAFLGTNNGLVFALYDGTNNPATAVNNPSTSVWHHIAGVRDISADTVALYVGGSQTSSVNDSTTSTPTYSDFNIGKQVNVSRAWTGSIDDVRIYNRALSAADITKLYASYQGIALGSEKRRMRAPSGISIIDLAS